MVIAIERLSPFSSSCVDGPLTTSSWPALPVDAGPALMAGQADCGTGLRRRRMFAIENHGRRNRSLAFLRPGGAGHMLRAGPMAGFATMIGERRAAVALHRVRGLEDVDHMAGVVAFEAGLLALGGISRRGGRGSLGRPGAGAEKQRGTCDETRHHSSYVHFYPPNAVRPGTGIRPHQVGAAAKDYLKTSFVPCISIIPGIFCRVLEYQRAASPDP